jgi:hypothetical protein
MLLADVPVKIFVITVQLCVLERGKAIPVQQESHQNSFLSPKVFLFIITELALSRKVALGHAIIRRAHIGNRYAKSRIKLSPPIPK